MPLTAWADYAPQEHRHPAEDGRLDGPVDGACAGDGREVVAQQDRGPCGHKIVAESITPEAMAMIPKLKRYQSYRHTLHGWSHFRLFALEARLGSTPHSLLSQLP